MLQKIGINTDFFVKSYSRILNINIYVILKYLFKNKYYNFVTIIVIDGKLWYTTKVNKIKKEMDKWKNKTKVLL